MTGASASETIMRCRHRRSCIRRRILGKKEPRKVPYKCVYAAANARVSTSLWPPPSHSSNVFYVKEKATMHPRLRHFINYRGAIVVVPIYFRFLSHKID